MKSAFNLLCDSVAAVVWFAALILIGAAGLVSWLFYSGWRIARR